MPARTVIRGASAVLSAAAGLIKKVRTLAIDKNEPVITFPANASAEEIKPTALKKARTLAALSKNSFTAALERTAVTVFSTPVRVFQKIVIAPEAKVTVEN